jgi:hypothetical protein
MFPRLVLKKRGSSPTTTSSSFALAFVALFCMFSSVGCVKAVLSKFTFSSAPPKLPETKPRVPRAPPPPEWFWEPVDAEVHVPSRKPTELPINGEISRVEGAGRVWDELSPEARERFKKDGVMVVTDPKWSAQWSQQQEQPPSMGAFYTHLREDRIPHVITMDALFAVVHLGLERALAEVEEHELMPLLTTVLEKLDTRLRAEGSASLGTELAEGYRIARGVIAAARALAQPTTYAPPPDLAAAIAQEKGQVEGHAGLATSPILNQPIDYTRFAPPSASAHPNAYRALAWLSAAPFALVGRGEAPGAQLSVAQARMNARAAMLLARVCARDVDAPLHTAYTKLLRLLAFVWGPPDDLSLTEIDQLATTAGVDLTKPDNISNVARVDKLRARAMAGRAPSAFDGSAGVGRAGVSVRVFGGHAAADSLVLQALVGAPVGLAQESAAAAPVDRLRQGRRVLPSTLDIPAWLGLREARAALRESRADAFDGYDAALVSLQRTRPAEGSALHASIHGSLVDSLIAWATVQSPPNPIRLSPAAERARVESMLAAWTLVRHSGQALSRRAPSPINVPELRVTGAPLPVFVEPLPEPIARLRGTMKQIRRGLAEVGGLKNDTPAMNLLVEIEEMLKAAQKGAERHANDEVLTNEEAAALASLPARLARVEEECGPESAGPVVAIVYSDPASHRVLASATGKIEPILMLARAANRDEPILVVGAHHTHHEIIESGFTSAPGVLHGAKSPALTDASWRARLKSTKDAPDRAAWSTPFRYSARK